MSVSPVACPADTTPFPLRAGKILPSTRERELATGGRSGEVTSGSGHPFLQDVNRSLRSHLLLAPDISQRSFRLGNEISKSLALRCREGFGRIWEVGRDGLNGSGGS